MAGSNSTKVKVSTAALLEAVKTRRVQLEKQHQKEQEKYDRELKAYSQKVVTALGEVFKKAKVDPLSIDTKIDYRNRVQVCVGNNLGRQPVKPILFYSDEIDRLIKTLEIAAEETITISAEDAAQYLG